MNNLLQKIVPVLFLFLILIIIILCMIVFKQNREIKSKNVEIQNYLQQRDGTEDKISKLEQEFKETSPKKHPIEIKVQNCMKDCNYTTACMSDCVNNSIDDWEKNSKESIMGLKKVLNNEQYTLLINSQEKWEVYKKAQVELLRNTIGNLQGTMYTNILSGNIADIYEQRAKDLHSILYFLEERRFVLP